MERTGTSTIIDFSDYIVDRTERFTGREWVFNAVNDWLASSNVSRFFLVTGAPGCGKTAVCGRLVQFSRGEICPSEGLEYVTRDFLDAVHFCSARDRLWIDPREFAHSLALQLADRYPGYAQALAEESGDQQIHIEVDQRVQHMEGGEVTGVVIKNLELKGGTPEDAFTRLVREPLEALFREGRDEQIVILVDALDEALLYSGEVGIVPLLAQAEFLPPQVRFIVTSRPRDEVLRALRRSRPQPQECWLTAGAGLSHSLEDVKRHVLQMLSQRPELANKLASNLSQEIFAATVQQSSEGNFLYVNYLLQMLASSEQQVISQVSLEQLPVGLDAIYIEFLDRLVGGNEESWSEKYAPLAGTLAVAQQALDEGQLASFVGTSRSKLRRALRELRQFLDTDESLPASQRPYALYHRSFADFLLDEDRSEDYWCEALEQHERIVEYYRGSAASWEDVDLSQVGDYGLRHLAYHLLWTGHRNELYRLLTESPDWMNRKFAAFGDDSPYISDVELAISAFPDPRTADEVQALVRLQTALGMVLKRRYDRAGGLVDLEWSIEAFEQAVEQSQSGSPDVPLALSGLGEGLSIRYERTGDPADLQHAIEVFEQAIERSQPRDPRLPSYLSNLGMALGIRCDRTGDPADLQRAIEVCEQAVEQTHPGDPGLPLRLGSLSEVLKRRHERTGDPADLQHAIEVFEQAVEQSQPRDPRLLSYLSGLGEGLSIRYERTGDLADLNKSITAWEQALFLLQDAFVTSPVAYKIGQQRAWAPLSARLVSAYLKQAQVNAPEARTARRRALEVAEGSKSRLLSELSSRTDLPAPEGIPTKLVEREQRLLADLTALDTAALTAQGVPITSTEEASYLVPLQQRQERLQELENLWTQMVQAGHEAADYVALRRGTPPTWEDLARLATESGSETALISFFITEDHALLFIVRAGWKEPAIVATDFDEFTWTDTMKRLFRELHTSRSSIRRLETWYRPLKVLLEMVNVHLDGVTRIVFAPYSNGHLIPWSVVAERAGWRGPEQQALPLVTLPSLGLLVQLRNRFSRGDGSVLVVGNTLGDLHYAEQEAHEVAGMLDGNPLLGDVNLLLGSQATRSRVEGSLLEATVVHMSGHAYFDNNSPLDSGIVLAGYDILTARDVIRYRLKADLVVLSASETGMATSLGGDELAGLAQAFLQAGARSLIVSFWMVDDSSTASLMREFYSDYRAGFDKAQALSQAMTHIREQEKWQHPYYWAPFVLMGEW